MFVWFFLLFCSWFFVCRDCSYTGLFFGFFIMSVSYIMCFGGGENRREKAFSMGYSENNQCIGTHAEAEFEFQAINRGGIGRQSRQPAKPRYHIWSLKANHCSRIGGVYSQHEKATNPPAYLEPIRNSMQKTREGVYSTGQFADSLAAKRGGGSGSEQTVTFSQSLLILQIGGLQKKTRNRAHYSRIMRASTVFTPFA